MSIARRLDGLSAFAKADLKFVIAIEGFDLTSQTGTFKVSTAPGTAAVLTAAVTMIEVVTDGDGVPTTLVQVFLAKSPVEGIFDGLAAGDRGAVIQLYYEFRVSALFGDLGTGAETTLLYGNFHLKGSI